MNRLVRAGATEVRPRSPLGAPATLGTLWYFPSPTQPTQLQTETAPTVCYSTAPLWLEDCQQVGSQFIFPEVAVELRGTVNSCPHTCRQLDLGTGDDISSE